VLRVRIEDRADPSVTAAFTVIVGSDSEVPG
jgi:hypothetical protein